MAEEAPELGAVRYVEKGTDPTTIVATIEKVAEINVQSHPEGGSGKGSRVRQ